MRVLIVCPFLPFPLESGGTIRVYNILRDLSRRHKVSLLCFGTATREATQALHFCENIRVVPPPRFPRPWLDHARGLVGNLPMSVCFPSAAISIALKQLLATHRFDIIQIEFLGLAHLVQALNGHRTVLVKHSIASELRERQLRIMPWGARRIYYEADLLKIRRYEQNALKAFDGCITVSSRDEEVVRKWATGVLVATVPSGVDTDYFYPVGHEGRHHSLVFVGSFRLHPANVDGVLHLARDIFPIVRQQLPDVHLTVVGAAPPPEVLNLVNEPGIEVAGHVEDIRPYLAQADLVVLPLRAGAGTKIRIFTAMAMQKTVLATSIAAEGIEATQGEEIVIADGAERFAEEVVSLLRDGARRTRIGLAARAKAVTEYDWRVIGRKLEDFYTLLLEGGGRSSSQGLADQARHPVQGILSR